jgi:phosphomevalonate kinase
MTSEEYDALSKLPATEWPKTSPLTELYDTLRKIRENLRVMGETAGVPIEPPPQTALCDSTMKLPGVVATLVPGAGGYDAVACLYIDRPSVLEAIGELWSEWKEPIICPLAVKACDTGLQLEEEQ